MNRYCVMMGEIDTEAEEHQVIGFGDRSYQIALVESLDLSWSQKN